MKALFINSILLLALFQSNYSHAQANCYPDQGNSYWKIDETLYGSRLLSSCYYNAYYNCHGFVMSYFEKPDYPIGTCPKPGWDLPVAAPYTCPNDFGVKGASDYQNSGKYIQVCSETYANIAYYLFDGANDHSAVKEVTGGGYGPIKYISKYGSDGPLVAHNLTGSWYHLAKNYSGQIQYWSYIGQITGNQNITGTSPQNYSVINIPTVNYSWSIISGYSNVYISSGANQSAVTLTPTHSGTAVLKLTVSTACGSIKTQTYNINIQTNICLEGTFVNLGNTQNLNTTNSVSVGGVTVSVGCPNASSYTWQKTSGNVNDLMPNGSNASFTMTSGGSISILVTAKNGPFTIASRNITFYNYGSYSIYPNPSSTSLAIDLNEEMTFDVVLEGMDGQTTKEIKNYKGGSQIDLTQFKNGEFSLRVYLEGKLLNSQRIFISK